MDQSLEARPQSFLTVASEIAQGNFTLRGEVSPDAAGASIEVINVLVARMQRVLAETRAKASHVAASALDMVCSTDQALGHARDQEVELERALGELEVVRQAAAAALADARLAALTAEEALGATRRGQAAVWKSQEAMQRIRAAVLRLNRDFEAARAAELAAEDPPLLAVAQGGRAAARPGRPRLFLVREGAPGPAAAAEPPSISDLVLASREVLDELDAGIAIATEAGDGLQLVEALADRSSQLTRAIHRGAEGLARAQASALAMLERIARSAEAAEGAAAAGHDEACNLGQLADSMLTSLEAFVLDEEEGRAR